MTAPVGDIPTSDYVIEVRSAACGEPVVVRSELIGGGWRMTVFRSGIQTRTADVERESAMSMAEATVSVMASEFWNDEPMPPIP